MQIAFTKMQGCGNDYIYIDCRADAELEEYAAGIAGKLADRHFGVGGDGVILISSGSIADCKMRIFNADGSEAEMCGNGIRCAAKFVGGDTVRVETRAGIKTVVRAGGKYRVDMGTAKINGDTVDIGNPHKVFFAEDADGIDIADLSRGFEDYNVEFVEIIGKNEIKMRVFERGSGETLSCGTGACAAAVMAAACGFVNGAQPITVRMRGGELTVELNYMAGGAAGEMAGGDGAGARACRVKLPNEAPQKSGAGEMAGRVAGGTAGGAVGVTLIGDAVSVFSGVIDV
jgi:diaminopimelate epimerase